MNKKLFFLSLATMLTAFLAHAYDKSEYKVRPWEIIQGLKPHSELVWDMAKCDLAEWKVSGKAKLSATQHTKLWGDSVAKLDLPPNGSVTIRQPARTCPWSGPCSSGC